jgi:hypothetical protein
LADLRKPGASISEGEAANILEAIYPEDDTVSTPGNERAREVWGFASAPRWLKEDGTTVSEEEFNSMSAKEVGKLSIDLGDFEPELPSGDLEIPAPKTATRVSVGGRPLAEVNKKENFPARKLFDYLGIDQEDGKLGRIAIEASELLKSKYGIPVPPRTITDSWNKGIPTDVIQYLLDTEQIPSVSEVFGEQFDSFEQYPTVVSVQRKVFDSLIESGLSQDAAQAAFGQIFKGGSTYQGMLTSEQQKADYKAGKMFSLKGIGEVAKYDGSKLAEVADALNAVREKNGADPVDAGTLFSIKETAQAAAPKPAAPKPAAPKPKGALIEKYPEVTRWEKLTRSSAKNLSDEEMDEALEVLEALSNPLVTNTGPEGEISFPDGLKPSDERVKNAKEMLQMLEDEIDFRGKDAASRSVSEIRDAIEKEYGWRTASEGLPKNFSEWTRADRDTFSERLRIEEEMGIKSINENMEIKSAWSGVSVRTKGDRAQRYKIM